MNTVTADRREECKRNPKPIIEESDSENEDEEDPVLIKWETEWRRKPGSIIIH